MPLLRYPDAIRPEDHWLRSVQGPARLIFIGEKDSSIYRTLGEIGPSLQLSVLTHSPSEQDVRLLSFPRETFAAAYWELQDESFAIEHAQRVFANLFQALLPRTGKLALSRPKNLWTDVALESLLRQTGFKLLSRWEGSERMLWICERI